MKVEDDETTGKIVLAGSDPSASVGSDAEDDDDDAPTTVGASAYQALARKAFTGTDPESDDSALKAAPTLAPPAPVSALAPTQPAPGVGHMTAPISIPATLQAPLQAPPRPPSPPTPRKFEVTVPSPATPMVPAPATPRGPPPPSTGHVFATMVPLVRKDEAAQSAPPFFPTAAGVVPAPGSAADVSAVQPLQPGQPGQPLQPAPFAPPMFAPESMVPSPDHSASLRIEILIGITSFLLVAVPALLYIMLH